MHKFCHIWERAALPPASSDSDFDSTIHVEDEEMSWASGPSGDGERFLSLKELNN